MSKSFIYTITESPARGSNLRVNVYRIKRNAPVYLGCQDVNTASYYGNYATACQVIAAAGEAPMGDSYRLRNKLHSVVEV